MKKIFSIILASIAMTSCVETVILPDNKTVDDDYWQKKSEVDAIVSTAYAQLRSADAIRNLIVWGDFRSDELVINPSVPASSAYKTALAQIYSLNIDPTNAFTSWYPFYSAINYCNLVLEKAEGVISIDPDYTRGEYEANKAQVLALRAYCYFTLLRVFHDIPVTPHAYLNSSDDMNAEQQAPSYVIDMCINDLNEALKYAVAGNTYEMNAWRNKGYFNRDGINALLADIYLWRASINRDANDYEACVQHCNNIINAKKSAYETENALRDDEKKDYYLAESDVMYNRLFGQTGQNADESIFEVQFRLSSVQNIGLDQMFYRIQNNTRFNFGYLKAALKYGAVDNTGNGVWINDKDQRLYEYLYSANSSGVEQFEIRKYIANATAGKWTSTSRDANHNILANWIVYRLTDVMLMKAEALVQLYNLGGKDAEDTRNEEAFKICQFVNSRALPKDDGSYKKADYEILFSTYRDRMEELVLAERARELCFEGKRWYDLMRYNYRHTASKADLTKKLTEGYVANSDAFYELALRKYSVPSAMRAKMRDDRYLYMPLNEDEVEINTNLVQNPVYRSKSK